MKRQNKIEAVFDKGPAYVAYLTAGDGGIHRTLTAMHALVEGGVDMIEVGVPFSDPVADGPIIQQASHRALEAGTTLKKVLTLVAEFRESSDIPVVLFSYCNPVEQCVRDGFFDKASSAGVDGFLLVDLPLEAATLYQENCQRLGMNLIFMLAPSTSLQRIQKINQHAHGMLYYACRKGVTGVQKALPDDFVTKLKTIKANVSVPVIAGFGIADRASAAAVLQQADGFVVGSRFVQAIAEGCDDVELTRLAKSIDPRLSRSGEKP